MKVWIAVGFVLLFVMALMGAAGETYSVELFKDEQYFVYQRDTLWFFAKSPKISDQGTFTITFTEYKRFSFEIYQDNNNDKIYDKEDAPLTNNTSQSIMKGETGIFLFKLRVNDANLGRYQMEVSITETNNATNKNTIPFTLYVLSSCSITKKDIQEEIRNAPSSESEEFFLFPSQSIWLEMSSSPAKEDDAFCITISEEEQAEGSKVLEYEVLEGDKEGEPLELTEGKYRSTEVKKEENKTFYIRITVPEAFDQEDDNPRVVRVVIEIYEEENTEEKKSQTYEVHILQTPRKAIEDSANEIRRENEDMSSKLDKLEKKSKKERFIPFIFTGSIIALILFILYQRKDISQLEKENEELKKKINIDRDILRDVLEKL
jgi:hypothetical protein